MMAMGLLIIGDEILSGRRQDQHFAHAIDVVAKRGIELAWVRYSSDDSRRLIQQFKEIRQCDDICFSFGGIGATPDDLTRQSIAAAFELPLIRHPQAVAEIEAHFGERAYPNRILMADLPQGAQLIPNPYNRIPGFSLERVHCVPGFPEMAWPMMEWVLAEYYASLSATPPTLHLLTVYDVYESELLDVMQSIVKQYPDIKFSSLPRLLAENHREIELGFKGSAQIAATARQAMIEALEARKIRYSLSSQ